MERAKFVTVRARPCGLGPKKSSGSNNAETALNEIVATK